MRVWIAFLPCHLSRSCRHENQRGELAVMGSLAIIVHSAVIQGEIDHFSSIIRRRRSLIGHFVAALDQCVTPLLGHRTVNTDPFPGSLVTVTSPPIMRASLRVMARPSPVPP